jgi:hypothetical protein
MKIKRLELHSPKAFYPDSRQLFSERGKPPNHRESFDMEADYARQVVVVNGGLIIPFTECSHWTEEREDELPPVEYKCECGKVFTGAKAGTAYGGHRRHCTAAQPAG